MTHPGCKLAGPAAAPCSTCLHPRGVVSGLCQGALELGVLPPVVAAGGAQEDHGPHQAQEQEACDDGRHALGLLRPRALLPSAVVAVSITQGQVRQEVLL